MVFTKKNKVMKAPKKIYLHPTAKGEVGASWLKFRLTDEDIEYTSTDAFIKKACDLFRRIDCDDTLPPYETTEEFIKYFKKYMKGE